MIKKCPKNRILSRNSLTANDEMCETTLLLVIYCKHNAPKNGLLEISRQPIFSFIKSYQVNQQSALDIIYGPLSLALIFILIRTSQFANSQAVWVFKIAPLYSFPVDFLLYFS